MPNSANAQPLSDRLTSLEGLFTHLERQVADLNQVVLEQARLIEGFQKRLSRLETRPDEQAADEPAGEDS